MRDEHFDISEKEMLETYIAELTDACEELMEVIEELKRENEFLTDVIIENGIAHKAVRKRMEREKEKAKPDSTENLTTIISLKEWIKKAKKQ